jgi:hypothetical protein
MSERISRDGAQERKPRTLQTREREARTEYVPASTLPTPEPRDGLRFRWVATSLLGQPLSTNVSKRMREHWEPIKAEDFPELMLEGDKNGNVEVQGLLLCAQAEELAMARNAHFANHAQAQAESVDNAFLRQSDPRMPLFSDKRSTSTRGNGFGSGSK